MSDNHRDFQDPDGKRLGVGFFFAACAAGLGILTVLFSDWEERQYNPNQNPQSQFRQGAVEVVLERNRAGHYLANGMINGTPVTFLLDTGATHVSVPQHIAERAGLRRGMSTAVNTAAGDAMVYTTRIDELQLGDIRLRDLPASINPHMEFDEILLGMSALKQLDFTQQGPYLTLRLHGQ